MSSQRQILIIVAVVVIIIAIGVIYAMRNGTVPTTAPDMTTPATLPAAASTTPAEAVSNTTFDIVSPSTQTPPAPVSDTMPGSSGY